MYLYAHAPRAHTRAHARTLTRTYMFKIILPYFYHKQYNKHNKISMVVYIITVCFQKMLEGMSHSFLCFSNLSLDKACSSIFILLYNIFLNIAKLGIYFWYFVLRIYYYMLFRRLLKYNSKLHSDNFTREIIRI